ncbi:MAG: YqaJ viral recombinase family protein [Vampirovibrionales bacterium]|jgi:hypothetical protein|nr:YqaJ viral recombinase family protein [Vampirovibrionales bacterium]
MIVHKCEQGSEEWQQLRCGVVTMSHAKELLTGGKGKTRQSYILDVVSERLSGKPIESYSSIDMQRGQFLEPYALKLLEEVNGAPIDRVGFITTDDGRIGCSPDGLFGEMAGIEIKCPNPRQHIRNIKSNGFDDYIAQVQGNMWITGRQWWCLVSFCPWVTQIPFYYKIIDIDDAIIRKIEESAISAADEIDALVAEFSGMLIDGRIISMASAARAAWESTFAINDEVEL